jgi:hypothetical protein
MFKIAFKNLAIKAQTIYLKHQTLQKIACPTSAIQSNRKIILEQI